MAYANGRLPASALAPIAGGQLRKDAAARWNAMNFAIRARTGVTVLPNGPQSSYRTYAGQVAMKAMWTRAGRPQNAATPGTSNHGLGLAVDANRPDLVNRYGAPFGFQKRWSDAAWEPWHMKWAGFGKAAPENPRVKSHAARRLGLKRRDDVRRFQRQHGLTADGIVGPTTLRAIKSALKKRSK